jgi:putative effector of murein hydrolase
MILNINLNNISRFFQHRMKKVLKKYLWKFILVYINNIIIFFSIFENYLKHSNQILIFLKKLNVIFSFFKLYFDYSHIKNLKRYVNKLKINIIKKRLK